MYEQSVMLHPLVVNECVVMCFVLASRRHLPVLPVLLDGGGRCSWYLGVVI